jgi:hypothetical protein
MDGTRMVERAVERQSERARPVQRPTSLGQGKSTHPQFAYPRHVSYYMSTFAHVHKLHEIHPFEGTWGRPLQTGAGYTVRCESSHTRTDDGKNNEVL